MVVEGEGDGYRACMSRRREDGKYPAEADHESALDQLADWGPLRRTSRPALPRSTQ